MKKNILLLIFCTVIVGLVFGRSKNSIKQFEKEKNPRDALLMLYNDVDINNVKKWIEKFNTNSDFFNNFTIEKISIPSSIKSKQSFNKDFSIMAFISQNGKKEPLSDANFIVKYPQKMDDDTVEYIYKYLTTDDSGKLSVSLPTFSKPYLGQIEFILNVFNKINIDNQPAEYLLNDHALEHIKALFDVKVAAIKKTGIRATLAITDFNENGVALTRSDTATKLLGTLLNRGYWGVGIYETKFLRKEDDEAVINDATLTFDGSVKDFIFGRNRILDLHEKNGRWICTMETILNFWDFPQQKIKKQVTCKMTSEGKNKWEAINLTRSELINKKLADEIEFGYEFN